MLDSVTLLMTKEAVDNARAVTEAKYKCFETKKNFETEWCVGYLCHLWTTMSSTLIQCLFMPWRLDVDARMVAAEKIFGKLHW